MFKSYYVGWTDDSKLAIVISDLDTLRIPDLHWINKEGIPRKFSVLFWELHRVYNSSWSWACNYYISIEIPTWLHQVGTLWSEHLPPPGYDFACGRLFSVLIHQGRVVTVLPMRSIFIEHLIQFLFFSSILYTFLFYIFSYKLYFIFLYYFGWGSLLSHLFLFWFI